MRYDAFTQERALRWLAAHHPVLLHVGFGETDHDAHARRYDHTIAMLHATDRMLSELWHAAQADRGMAGRTVMVVTTDHGRGATARDWTDHGRDVANAARWWFLAAGAGVTPQGVVDRPMTQSQVAPTILMLLGLDAAGLTAPVAAPARDVIAPGS
jgi:bisphosphoglycerate-independent phosphoglycerate mutase (AlkP superfamily)